MTELEQCRSQQGSSDYEFEVLEHKGKVEYFCQQLAKKKGCKELFEMMESNDKWSVYVQRHCHPPKQYDKLLN